MIDQRKLYYCHGDGEPPDHWFDAVQVRFHPINVHGLNYNITVCYKGLGG